MKGERPKPPFTLMGTVAKKPITWIVAAITIAAMIVASQTPAAAVIVGSRFQAEDMTISGDIIVKDETRDQGTHIRFTGNADQADRASESINPDQPVDQIQIRARESGSGLGDDRLAVYIDGNQVGTVLPPASTTWATLNLDLANPVSAQAHTLQIGPAQANDAFVALDWFELHNTGGTPPPAQCADGQDNDGDGLTDFPDDPGCSSSTDDDETASGGTCTGTAVNPTSDLQSVIDSPGTYCLNGGVYQEADKQIVINNDNVTVKNVPGERAEIRGRVRTNDGASNFRMEGTDVAPNVEGIALNSTYSPISWSTSGGMGHFTSDPHLVRGNGTTFVNVEFDGDNDVLGDPWYSSRPSTTPARAIGTCALVADGTDGAPAADVVFVNNDIHNCGASPNNQADNVGTHAIYLSGGLRVQIEHNQIYENGTRGVQIRNGTDDTHVFGNVIDENYIGIIFDDPTTNGNIAENNVITRSGNVNIRALSDTGSGNVVRDNCGYGAPIPNSTTNNVSFSGNVNVSSNPYGVDPEPSADAKVSDTQCNAKLPAGSRFLP